jgi:hypothetical protein
MGLERMLRWLRVSLPRLNRSILDGDVPAAALPKRLGRFVLADLPEPEGLPVRQAQRLLVGLSFAGASAARHYQEQDHARTATPELAFAPLAAGTGRIPFLEYYARLARQLGHYHRDSFVALVRWNVPTVEVCWQSERLAVLPGVFDGARVYTYAGDPGERAFFELTKQAEAVELAANLVLRPMSDGEVGLASAEAVRRLRLATVLLGVLRQLTSDFSQLPPDVGLRPAYFIDVFRQFAAHWQLGDLPPSGAQDPEALKRDLLLGLDIPTLDRHVRRQLPALLAADRADVLTLLGRPPMPVRLLAELDLAPTALWAMPAAELRQTVRDHPALAAWYLLLTGHARAAAAHLAVAKKFLFRPAHARAAAGIPDVGLVPRLAGTTGMTESVLDRLTQARHNHLLAPLHQIPHLELVGLAGIEPVTPVSTRDLPAIVRFRPKPVGTRARVPVRPRTGPDAARPLAGVR